MHKVWGVFFCLAGVVLCGLLLGCSTTSSDKSGGPTKRDVNKVLSEYRRAETALRANRFAEAKSLLDDAILTISGVPAKDPDARRARGLFHEESGKTYFGEPYERVLAYFYRGILYWMEGEPDNARACFRNGQFLDSDAQSQQYAGDYALLDYLDGLASVKLGADGADAWQRARANAKHTSPPPYDPQANVLFFLQFGQGPVKFAGGEYGEMLLYRDGFSEAYSARITIAGVTQTAGIYDDVTFQAHTRGGRVMDKILANKAAFKGTTDAVGNATLLSGLVLTQARDRTAREVGAGLALFGVLNKVVSAATTPRADTRSWDNLPQFLSFAALAVSPGRHNATVEFLDGRGQTVPRFTKNIVVEVAPGRDTVVFLSDR